MKECLVIGRANVGKTAFVLNFADFLGVHDLDLTYRRSDGILQREVMGVATAREHLVSSHPHTTRCLQTVTLQLPVGKGMKEFELTDSSGLIDEIHNDRSIRKAMAQTLGKLRNCHLIIHMIDLGLITQEGVKKALGEIDYQINQFGKFRGGYMVLANKIDLPGAQESYQLLKGELDKVSVYPVSALYFDGFPEVRKFLRRCL